MAQKERRTKTGEKEMSEWTTARMKKSTKKRVQAYGKMGESFDDALTKVLDKVERMEGKKKT